MHIIYVYKYLQHYIQLSFVFLKCLRSSKISELFYTNHLQWLLQKRQISLFSSHPNHNICILETNILLWVILFRNNYVMVRKWFKYSKSIVWLKKINTKCWWLYVILSPFFSLDFTNPCDIVGWISVAVHVIVVNLFSWSSKEFRIDFWQKIFLETTF